jgi:hypothetical protein
VVVEQETEEQSEAKPERALHVDDTPNLRTCVVNSDIEPTNFENNFTVDILTTTIQQLTDRLAKERGVKQPARLRNLEKNLLYAKEETTQLLKCFHQFQEGSARITIESGEYCSFQEVSIKVQLYDDKQKEYDEPK